MHPYYIVIRIEGLPKTTNAQTSMHWANKGRMVKEWHNKVFAAICGKIPPAPLKKAAILCIRNSSTCPDYDGLVSSFKHPIDALIKCGVIEDDSMDNIGMPGFFWKKAQRGKGSIQIEVSSRSA